MPALLATAWGLLGLVLRCASIAGYCLGSFGTSAAVCQHCWLLLGAVVTKDAGVPASLATAWGLLGLVLRCASIAGYCLGSFGTSAAVCQHCWLLLGVFWD